MMNLNKNKLISSKYWYSW